MKLIKLFENFAILPSFSILWMTYCGKKIYDIQFAWLKWALITTNYKVIEEDFYKNDNYYD